MAWDCRFHERRAASRYAANRPPAFLGWYEGDAYRTTRVRVVDVSVLGMLVEVQAFPPPSGDVWLSLVGQKPSQWLEVGVVRTSRQWRLLGLRRLVRLKFLEACPYDLFKTAIDGFSRQSHVPDDDSEHLQGHRWR
jgi:hypothetical protein